LLGGGGSIVEADETFMVPRKGVKVANAGHHRTKVVSLVSREGKTRSFHVANVDYKTLKPILERQIAEGTHLMTDGAWMSIARRLALTYGTGGLAILHQAGIACGEEYAKHLQSKLGLQASQQTLMENLVVMLRAAGLGKAEVSKTGDGFTVKVREPIIPATETKIHDHFLTGVIAGATGHLFATRYSVEKVRFQGDELEFVLGHRRAEALTKVAASRGPRALAKDEA